MQSCLNLPTAAEFQSLADRLSTLTADPVPMPDAAFTKGWTQAAEVLRRRGGTADPVPMPDAAFTKGWTIIKAATAFSGDAGSFFYDPGLSGGADHPLTIGTLRKESEGYGGFVFGADYDDDNGGREGWGWVRSQVKTPDELIINITRDRGGDVHVQPGASKRAFRTLVAKGYEVEYSPDEDQSFVDGERAFWADLHPDNSVPEILDAAKKMGDTLDAISRHPNGKRAKAAAQRYNDVMIHVYFQIYDDLKKEPDHEKPDYSSLPCRSFVLEEDVRSRMFPVTRRA